MSQLASIIFICTENSARSQLAEAFFRAQAGDRFQVFSAGTQPGNIDPRVFTTLEARDISTEGLRSKSLSEFADQQFDYAVLLCDKARQECVHQLKAKEILSWDFEDPKPKKGQKPFDIVLNELSERIKFFLLFQENPSA
ncbi:arsenate reductase ArsC [Alkalimonas collagenimarina]|uniref:Arsenate reductase ArsC n=1 Tax=Alkalimonas collagenimarina TaxID=400390 RepID=A0ABT9GWK9_9GAMM|nr:arsenate reductase ArsC [Alkalimonas collagenimarina]MDP4535442.1 arsenate reductase ArsC [Alkalimonas collagenimarina]